MAEVREGWRDGWMDEGSVCERENERKKRKREQLFTELKMSL